MDVKFRECGGSYDESLTQPIRIVVQDVRLCTGAWQAPTVQVNTQHGYSIDGTHNWIAYKVSDPNDLVITWAGADNSKC